MHKPAELVNIYSEQGMLACCVVPVYNWELKSFRSGENILRGCERRKKQTTSLFTQKK
jgi:hypothetical protein